MVKTVINPQEFILMLIDENWDSATYAYKPHLQTHWIKPRQPERDVPVISITTDHSPVESHGFQGKIHYTRESVRIIVWTLKASQKHEIMQEIKRIIVEACPSPSTDLYPTPGIDTIIPADYDDMDDFLRSPLTFRRDMMVEVHYQQVYS